MKTRALFCWVGALGCLAVAGCIRGPFRSAIVGDKESATIQWVKAKPVLAPLSAPVGVLTDVVLVPMDTATLLSINCAWRPFLDNATLSGSEDHYFPAAIPNMFVLPLLPHLFTIGSTCDYYVDLFGNRTEWHLKQLLSEKRYDDALKIVTEGSGIPKPTAVPKRGLYWANERNEWAPIIQNTQNAWREQWTKQISDLVKREADLVKSEAERLGRILQTADSPEEWDKANAELERLGANVTGDKASWRALAVWREALRKGDYETASELLKEYPSVCFDGLPMYYAECVSRGFPKAFRAKLYDVGMLHPFRVGDCALLLWQQDTDILTHPRFRLPLEAALPALNGSLKDLLAFLDVTQGVTYAFAPVPSGDYAAVDELLQAKHPKRLMQAIKQKLLAGDAAVLVALVEMGEVEEAQRLWVEANDEAQNEILALALDEANPKGEQVITALSCPTRGVWWPAFQRLCRQKNNAMSQQRLVALQNAGWISEEKIWSTRKRLFTEAARALLARATAVTISLEIPHGEEEAELLTDFPEFKESFANLKQIRMKELFTNRPFKEILEVARTGNGATAIEMLKCNPSLRVVSPNDVVLGIETQNDAFAKALIQRCPNLNGEPDAVTPLMAAVWHNHAEIVNLLLSRKVNVNRNVSQEQFIAWASTNDAMERYLEERFDARNDVDAMYLALEILPSPASVRSLLGAGAYYDSTPPINTCLALAIRKNNMSDERWNAQCEQRVECALAILNAGAEANVFVCEEEEVRTIVLCAVLYTDSQELVRALVRKGAPVSLEAANAAIQKDWVKLGEWLHSKVDDDCRTENAILAENLMKYADAVPWLRALLRSLQ